MKVRPRARIGPCPGNDPSELPAPIPGSGLSRASPALTIALALFIPIRRNVLAAHLPPDLEPVLHSEGKRRSSHLKEDTVHKESQMATRNSGVRRIVVGLDGSESSAAALKWAVRLAKGMGGGLRQNAT